MDPTVAVPGGMSVSVLLDDSVLVGGVVPVTGVYQIQYELPVGGVTGVRLEVLEDASLPLDGPAFAQPRVTPFRAIASEPGELQPAHWASLGTREGSPHGASLRGGRLLGRSPSCT